MRPALSSMMTLALLLGMSGAVAALGGQASGTRTQKPAENKASSKAPDSHQPSVAAGAPAVKEDCGCDVKEPADAFATVNGVKITSTEVETDIKDDVAQIQSRVIAARQRELELEINSLLLNHEAKKRGITPSKLVDDEIISKVTKPTEAEAQAYYDKNKAKIHSEFKDVKENIEAYLVNQRQRERARDFAQSLRSSAKVSVLVKSVTPPLAPADRYRVLATVDGEGITSEEVEDNLRPVISKAQDQIYKLRKRGTDLKINDVLLQQEAAKEKMTAKALLDREVTSKTKVVTEADAKQFYDQNKDRLRGGYDQLRLSIIDYLQQQSDRAAETAFAERLRKPAKIEVFLKAPEPLAFKISTEDRPSKGPENAPVTIVEFTDYQCPSCAAEAPILQRLVSEYREQVRLVVRDFPLQQHPDAFKAAVAAEAARDQGKYWEYSGLLFHNQSALGPEKLKEYAAQLGLDRKKFDSDLDSNRFSDEVQRDLQEGMRLDLESTPSLFVNGKKIDDKTYESLKSAIDQALKERSSTQ